MQNMEAVSTYESYTVSSTANPVRYHTTEARNLLEVTINGLEENGVTTERVGERQGGKFVSTQMQNMEMLSTHALYTVSSTANPVRYLEENGVTTEQVGERMQNMEMLPTHAPGTVSFTTGPEASLQRSLSAIGSSILGAASTPCRIWRCYRHTRRNGT